MAGALGGSVPAALRPEPGHPRIASGTGRDREQDAAARKGLAQAGQQVRPAAYTMTGTSATPSVPKISRYCATSAAGPVALA